MFIHKQWQRLFIIATIDSFQDPLQFATFYNIFEGKLKRKEAIPFFTRDDVRMTPKTATWRSHLQVLNDIFCIANSPQDNGWTKSQHIKTCSAASNLSYSFLLAQTITRVKPIKDIITVCKSYRNIMDITQNYTR